MREELETEQLINCKFIDSDNKEYDLIDIKGKTHLEQIYSTFQIRYRPLINIINNSNSYILFDNSKNRNSLFTVENVTDEVREKCKQVGYVL